MRRRLHVDADAWWASTTQLDAIAVVQDAVARDRKLAFRYRRASGEEVERLVDPLGLVAKGASWYLVAQTPAGLRTYRVSRIADAQLVDQPCVRPPGFDLAAYWKASTRRFMESRSRYHATLRLNPQAAARVRAWHLCEPGAAELAGEPDGWVTLRLRFEDEEQARFVALGFGPRAEVVEPESLRQRVSDDLAAMIAHSRSCPPDARTASR
jgi:predicted DNA-binding transcriptional regulator YafY